MQARSILLISADGASAKKITAAVGEQVNDTLEWERAESLFDGLRSLQGRSYDLIVSDLFLPDGQGLATVRHLKQQAPSIPLIVLCHSRDREVAINAVRKGAHDFFCLEDLDAEHLRQAITAALSRGSSEEEKAAAERRTSARFPCHLAITYQTLEHPFLSGQGSSETLNISSKGLLFTTGEQQLTEGKLLQVSVDWPARLENNIPLKLVAEGRVVRCSNGTAAMRIDKYEFRTRKARPAAPANEGVASRKA